MDQISKKYRPHLIVLTTAALLISLVFPEQRIYISGVFVVLLIIIGILDENFKWSIKNLSVLAIVMVIFYLEYFLPEVASYMVIPQLLFICFVGYWMYKSS